VAALPVDPETGTVRDGSRLNKVLLLRLDAGELDEKTRAHAAEGVLAYSAVCTHQGCTVSGWLAPERVLACFCHESKFSATEAGKVVGGPSRARLPILPLTVVDGALIVAGGFTSKPGPKL
jgi:Rieske Fe-S protein